MYHSPLVFRHLKVTDKATDRIFSESRKYYLNLHLFLICDRLPISFIPVSELMSCLQESQTSILFMALV
jgi:hypothetical protein